jgi:succinate dehydrogenase / fumarate reductase membrane anchor subunit|tara:strand:- start:119 stop:442 length:324 start_codon:yes stop_codon:yes gene_type:complete
MIRATKKWLSIKITSGILIPFMVWFILNLVGILDANNSQFVLFLESFSTKIIFTLFLIFASIFYTLTISEVFEDYISNFKLKNAANRLLVFFSIIVTLILITFLFKI